MRPFPFNLRALTLTVALAALLPAPGTAQNTGYQGNFVSGEYHFSEDRVGYTVGIDWARLDPASAYGWIVGLSVGFSGNVGEATLPDSELRSAALQGMTGNNLISYDHDDPTMGYVFGARFLGVKSVGTNTNIGFGPRISYFTAQPVSLTVRSENDTHYFVDLVDVPYHEAALYPGVELHIQPGIEFAFRYAYLFRGGESPHMHMVAVAWILDVW